MEQQHSMCAYTSEFDRCPKEAAKPVGVIFAKFPI